MSGRVRLSGLDSYFLHAERRGWPMHVGSLALFEAPPLRDRHGHVRMRALRELVATRLPLVPRLAQRVEWPPFGMGRPEWVDVRHVDLSHHIRLAHLAPPGDPDELRRLVSALHAEPLDRSRPLWELWVVDGLDTGDIALVQKVHHAMVDGIGGVDVAAVMLDLDRTQTMAPPAEPSPAEPASPARVAVDDMGHALARVADLVRHPVRPDRAVAEVVDTARALARQRLAPASSLNRRTGTHRRYETVALPLDGARQVKQRLGGTVNDVVLAAVAGGLRDLALSRGERPGSVRVLVPVSVRAEDQRGTPGNLVSGMVVSLALGIADPVRSLHAVTAATSRGKQHGDADAFRRLLALSDSLPERGLAAVASLVHRQPFVNLVVTNVPGPQVPLYLLGARMLEAYPVVPLTRNLDVSVAVLSYDGTLGIGLLADRDAVPELDVLRDGIAVTFDDLLEATQRRSA